MKKAFRFYLQSLSLLAISSALIIACNNGGEENKEEVPESKMAEAIISGTQSDTTVNGDITFTTEPGGKVKMNLELTIPVMANHSVAVHIHEHGDCGDAGKGAHGHWNPTNKQHGKWGEGEFHSGDIGNVDLDSTGKGTLSLETDLWSIGGDMNTNIVDKAIIVHSGMDDFTSQPSGNAGSRIGCGVIKEK